MMKRFFVIISCFVIVSCTLPCRDLNQKATVKDLESRVELLKKSDVYSGARSLASTIETELLSKHNNYGLSTDEIRSLQYLYAYMPVNDMAENSFEYFVNVTKQAYQTQRLPWGKTVTPELFRYYVLPTRVNNETLDDARLEFYNELYPRIKDMSMYDAVIEVNHWCREKIVYKPTDGRTTQPTNTVARAYGRCGEESTVAVAALRSVGIPARQVYVPRWAHTNSNHAWVEVWVDGTWYYLGACEPEPMLNRGWFTASASRAMLVNSYAYGPLKPCRKSQINGEVISQSSCFTEVSSTATYTPVKKAVVKVTNKDGNPVEGASVSFSIINGSNLSSLADRYTDRDGMASLTTGLGTFIMEVYYAENGQEYFAAREFRVMDTDTLEIVLDKDERKTGPEERIQTADYVVTPPPETRFPTALSEEVQKVHDMRCALDDSVRMAHTATFRFNNPREVEKFTSRLVTKGLPASMMKTLTGILSQSLSGGSEIEKFLNNTKPENLRLAVQLLGLIRIKDIHEITADTYTDYLDGVLRLGDVYKDDPVYRQSVLNPRFSNEIPVAYKTKLWDILRENGMVVPGPDTKTLTAIKKALDKILLVDPAVINPRRFYMTPASVAAFGMADNANYTVYARALFSTAGIPNHVNPMTHEIQIYVEGQWQDYPLESALPVVKTPEESMATLFIEDPDGREAGRRYSLQRWTDNSYRPVSRFGMEASGRRSAQPLQGVSVEPGMYRIVTAIRSADGSMLSRIMSFEVLPGSEQTIRVQWYPVKDDELVVIGNMNAEWKYSPKDAASDTELTSIINTVGRHFFVLAFLEPTKEPSHHFIRELSGIGNAIKIPVLVLFNNRENMDFYFRQGYNVSEKIHYGFDSQEVVLNGLCNALKTNDLSARLPVVIVADSFGNIYYRSIGYNIGVPETITKLTLPI